MPAKTAIVSNMATRCYMFLRHRVTNVCGYNGLGDFIMAKRNKDRRDFIKGMAGVAVATGGPAAVFASCTDNGSQGSSGEQSRTAPTKIRFAAIGINHEHIYGMVDAVIRGGGALAAFYAPEADLGSKSVSGSKR
jgi:hypothetical protein